MTFILRYLKEYKWYATLAPLFKMLEAIFELLVPLVVADMIDRGIAQGDRGYVLRSGLLLLLLAVLGMSVSITAQYFAAKAAVLSTGRMRRDVYCHIQDFSDASMDRMGASALLTRLTSDLNQVQGGINMVLRLFLRSPFVVIGAMIMAGTISLRAMALFAAVILLLSLIVAGLMRRTLPMYREVQSRLEGLLTLARENLEGVRVIRAFVREDQERAHFARRNQALSDVAYRAGRYQSYLNPVTFVLVNLGIVVLLARSGGAVYTGALTTGEVIALYNYMSQILVELVKFANLVVQITRAYASVGRVRELMELTADERRHEGNDTTRPAWPALQSGIIGVEQQSAFCKNKTRDTAAITFSGVSFSYDQAKRALEELDFTVPKGTVLGIVGGTGAGKSTILRLLRHAYDATGGEVRLFGRPVTQIPDEEMARIVANVPQRVELFAGTVADNLRLGCPDAADAGLIKALQTAQAYDFVQEKGGLSAEVHKGGTNFSGGQRQRLSIARALAVHPQILLLDDATSALDAATERALLTALRGYNGLTTVIVSQRAVSVQHADQILVMEDGWCIGSGTHEELLARNEVYREIVEAGR